MVRLERDLPPDLAGRGYECPVCKATYETVGALWAHRGDYLGLAPDECGGKCAPPKRKYGNEPTSYCGVIYDSRLEAACAAELDRLMATDPPLVVRWERQVPRALGHRGLVTLVVDFEVWLYACGPPVPLEAKGRETPASRIKRAWFLETFGVPLRVVRTPAEIEPLLRELGGG